MESILKPSMGIIVIFTLILLNTSLEAQNLNINETISYINTKLDKYPCRYYSGYTKFKLDLTSDGNLSLREIPYTNDIIYADVANNLYETKSRSLNFDFAQIKEYNNSFIKIPCQGENPNFPSNCINETNITSGKVTYTNTLSICFTADNETQRSLLNAFKHLGSLIKEEVSNTKNTDPFSDENYNKKESNSITNQKVATTSNVKKENSQSNSKPINSQPGWIEKKGEVGNFYISFPSQPKYTQGSFHGWRANDKEGQVIYLLAYLEAPSSGQMNIATAEKYLLPTMFEGDIQVSKNYITYNSGLNALDFLYKTTNNPTMYKQGRVVIKGQKVYILQIQYYHKDLIYFDKFVKSLRFY